VAGSAVRSPARSRSGYLVIGLGFLPLGTGFMGYRPINYTESGQASGSLERSGGLWVPVEKFTAALYGHLSRTSLSTGEPLAKWYPDLDVAGYAINISAAEGMARPSMNPDHFRVIGTFSVGDPSGSNVRDLLLEDLRPDADTGELVYQGYIDTDGNPVTNGTLFGVMIEFQKGAMESTGQVVFGNGQIKLIMTDRDGQTIVAHPVAIISKHSSSDAEAYGRGPFFVEDLHYASVGAGSIVKMGFEFVVPSGYTPEAVSIKNTRFLLEGPAEQTFSDAFARFNALSSGSLVGGAKVTDLDTSEAESVHRF
jgi:hypothetical protein